MLTKLIFMLLLTGLTSCKSADEGKKKESSRRGSDNDRETDRTRDPYDTGADTSQNCSILSASECSSRGCELVNNQCTRGGYFTSCSSYSDQPSCSKYSSNGCVWQSSQYGGTPGSGYPPSTGGTWSLPGSGSGQNNWQTPGGGSGLPGTWPQATPGYPSGGLPTGSGTSGYCMASTQNQPGYPNGQGNLGLPNGQNGLGLPNLGGGSQSNMIATLIQCLMGNCPGGLMGTLMNSLTGSGQNSLPGGLPSGGGIYSNNQLGLGGILNGGNNQSGNPARPGGFTDPRCSGSVGQQGVGSSGTTQNCDGNGNYCARGVNPSTGRCR